MSRDAQPTAHDPQGQSSRMALLRPGPLVTSRSSSRSPTLEAKRGIADEGGYFVQDMRQLEEGPVS